MSDGDGVEKRTITFNSPDEKAAWLDGAANFDSRVPFVRDLAAKLAKPWNPNFLRPIAECTFRFVRDGVRYVRDPNWEEFSDTETVIRRGYGDCDDKARALVALWRAQGLDARIRPVYAPRTDDFVHVQAEVRWDGSQNERDAQPGGWLLADPILAGAQLGTQPSTLKIAGKYRIV